MKSLNSEQVKVVNDFIEFKENLRQKYYLIRASMSMMENVLDDIIKKYDGDHTPSAISMTALIEHTLDRIARFQVSKDNMLTLEKEVVEDERTAIKICIDFISEISIHIAELIKYADESDSKIFYKDIYDCKEHINNIINVIFDIFKE